MSDAPSPAVHTDPEPRGGVRRWFAVRFRSATAIYGLIVFTAFLTIASDGVDEAGHLVDAGEMLEESVPALLVFYAAHVFAHTLTDHGDRGLWPALRHAVHSSSGMLWSALPSIAILVIGALTGMSGYDVYWYASWTAVIMLTVLGYAAYSRRRAHPLVRIAGAVGTGVLGFVIILLEYALH